MSLPTLAFEGRIVKIDLKYTPQGKAVLNLDVACNSRRYNKDTNQWEDGDTYWLNNASLWDRKAEAAANMLQKGDIVTGTCALRTRPYEKDGQKRTATDHMIESIGKVALPPKDGAPAQSQSSGSWGSGGGTSDAWGSRPQGGGGFGDDESVPF